MVKTVSPAGDTDFHGKDANEEYQAAFRQHWIRLLWPCTKLLLWNLLIVAIGYSLFAGDGFTEAGTRHLLLAALLAGFLLVHFCFLRRLYCYFLYVVIITDKKIHRIKKTLLFVDEQQSIDLWMLQDVHKCQRGPIQNALQFGTLTLEAQETVLRLHFIPHVSKQYKLLMLLKERARSAMTRPVPVVREKPMRSYAEPAPAIPGGFAAEAFS